MEHHKLRERGLREKACRIADRTFWTAEAVVTGVSAFITSAFASGTGTGTGTSGANAAIETGVKSGLSDAWELLKAIGLPVAAIAIVFAAFQLFVNGDEGMKKAKKIALYVVIGIAILYLGPLLVETVSGWFSSAGSTTVFS